MYIYNVRVISVMSIRLINCNFKNINGMYILINFLASEFVNINTLCTPY